MKYIEITLPSGQSWTPLSDSSIGLQLHGNWYTYESMYNIDLLDNPNEVRIDLSVSPESMEAIKDGDVRMITALPGSNRYVCFLALIKDKSSSFLPTSVTVYGAIYEVNNYSSSAVLYGTPIVAPGVNSGSGEDSGE